MASLVTKEVEALRAVTDGQNLNSEQVGYLTRLANTEFGRDVFLGGQSGEPRFVEEARKNPQPAPEPVPQQSVAQQEAATAPLPPSALATMPAGMVRVPSFFSPRAAPVSFDDDIDINNLPDNLSSDQLRQALNQKAGDPAFELTESQNITRMRLNKKAGDEIDRAFIAANQAIPGLASLIGGAAKEWFLTTTGQPLGAAIADYVVTRMRAQDMRKQGPKSEADAAALEVQAQNQIAEYGDARLREAATLGESVRKSYINTRSLWNWARQFNDGMMSEGRKRDMLRENLTARGILRNPEQELLSPDQRRSMQMENEVILQREWEARKAGETEDPALDAASEDEEYRRQHAAYVQNKALDRANLGIARFNRGGQEVEERADIRFADPVRFPSPFTDRLITPMENTATLGSIALDPLNAAGGVLGATTKWRLIHRTASVLGKPLTGIEKGAAGIRAAMEARREARIIGLAGRLGMKVDDARFAYDRSTRGLLNVATGGGVAGFGLGYLMSKDENFNQMGDALMVGGAILPALRGAGFVIRNTPKVAGVGGIIMQEAKAGPMGDISRIARNSTNHAEVIRAARPASAQELLQSGVVPPQYARHLRTYTDRAGNLNMAGGAARGADSTLKRVAQNPSNPENVRRFARLADQAGATGLVRALDDVASGTVAAGIGIAPLVAIAPEPEQAGSMIGGALAFGGAGGFIGGRASRAAEAFDIDVARTMVDLNAQGADVGTLFSLPRKSLEKIVNIQATAANKGVDLVLLRDEDYRATLPDVSQGTHMQRAGNVKHTVQEGDTLDALARRYYGTGEAWSQIVAANEGKIVENGGLPVGVELDMPGDNRWRMFVNMGHYSLEGGTVRVAKQADGTTRVSVMKDDGTSAYDFQTPNPEGLRVKDGQKVSAYEPLTNKIDRSLTAMHEFGHEVMRSDMFDGDHRIELRAIVQQIYGADGVQVRKRDYAARLVDREIESGVSEGVEFEFANEQERRDVRDGRVTIAQLRRQRGQQVKSRQELIDEKVAELEQDSVDRTGSPDAWIQDEIVNETLASEVNALELSRIRRGDNPEFFSARVGEAINTMTGRLLEFFGVKLNRSTGKPLDIPSTIFRENPLMKDPVLRKRLLEYVRDYDRYLVGLEDAGSANAKGARMAKSDRAEDFGNSPLVTLHPDPKTGRMENAFLFRGEDGKFYFKEQGDIDAAYKLQREQIRNMVRAQGSRKVPVGSGVFGVRTDDAGRTFVGGAKLPNEFDSMIHVPEHLRKFARALEEGATTGKSWIIQNHFVGSSDSGSYKLSRVRAGGRTIPREAVFINWKVTGADNILGVFLDLDAFRAATMKAINNNELPVFNNDISVVQQKLLQLMDNHRNGRSGAAGLDASPDVAIEMKNTLNGLIGTGTAVQRSTDAFTSLNPRGSIRTYRLDRIDSVKPTGRTGLHADYDKINQNRMPDAEPVDGPNNNRMPSALPQSGMAMPEVPANLSTDQILRELEENQGYLGLSTLGMREGRPVKGGAQQTRELLKRNTALNEELRRRGGPQEESDVARVLRQRGQAMPDVADAPPFYLKSSQALDAKVQGKAATVDQIKAILTNPQNGIKAEELKWTGVMQEVERLAKENNGKVPKEALLRYLAEDGAVRLEEVQLGGRLGENYDPDIVSQINETARQMRIYREDAENVYGPDRNKWPKEVRNGPEITRLTQEHSRLVQLRDETARPSLPRYSDADFVLPGGNNYREVLLTMPVSELPLNVGRGVPFNGDGSARWQGTGVVEGVIEYPVEIPGAGASGSITYWPETFNWRGDKQGPKYVVYTPDVQNAQVGTLAEAMQTIRDAYMRRPEMRSDVFKSSHFDTPNYVAHMRLNERLDAAGKPGLFIEEIQSDRHQKGREKGYREDATDVATDAEMGRFYSGKGEMSDADWQQLSRKVENRSRSESGVPDAPLRKEWPLHMFKRALRDAVSSGKDWIGWTTGITQVDRYTQTLRQRVKSISWSTQDGLTVVDVKPTRGERIYLPVKDGKIYRTVDKQTLAGKDLAEVIGKEPAAKVGQSPSGDLKGDELTIGGEGMKGFYDQILPKEISKYVRQWGGQVEKGSIDVSNQDSAYRQVLAQQAKSADAKIARNAKRALARLDAEELKPIWRVNITPQMRDGIKKAGQALFVGGAAAVVAEDQLEQ